MEGFLYFKVYNYGYNFVDIKNKIMKCHHKKLYNF